MIRKLLLPALLTGLLAGCVTDYGYRDGYYYGQPSVEYRYEYGYGYPGWYGYYPYGERYRYYNGYPYYSYPYHGYPYGYPRDYRYRHHHDDHSQPPISQFPIPHRDTDPQPRHDSRPPPWRDPGHMGRNDPPRPQFPNTPPSNMPPPRTHSDHDGSVIGQMMRRGQPQQRRDRERAETNER